MFALPALITTPAARCHLPLLMRRAAAVGGPRRGAAVVVRVLLHPLAAARGQQDPSGRRDPCNRTRHLTLLPGPRRRRRGRWARYLILLVDQSPHRSSDSWNQGTPRWGVPETVESSTTIADYMNHDDSCNHQSWLTHDSMMA